MSSSGEQPIQMTPSQFEEGVRQAAQEVAQVHRRRLVIHGFLAGLLATALIALPSVFFVGKHNCHSIRKLATAQEQTFKEAIESRRTFLKQSSDRLGLNETQFQELLERNDAAQRRQLRAVREVAHADCTYI